MAASRAMRPRPQRRAAVAYLYANGVPAGSFRGHSMPGQRVAVGLACGVAGWIPRSGETRTLQDPDVAIRTTTKTTMASPRNATKYSEAERPRRCRLMAGMVPQIREAPRASCRQLRSNKSKGRGKTGEEERPAKCGCGLPSTFYPLPSSLLFRRSQASCLAAGQLLQPVGGQSRGDHRDCHERRRQQRQPPGVGEHLLPLGDHRAP